MPSTRKTITVPLDDLALVMYRDPSLLTERGLNPRSKWCGTCGQAAGAHYCAPREAARHRLERAVEEAQDAA